MNQEGQRDPAQLIVAGDGGHHPLQADGRGLLRRIGRALPHAEDGEAHEQRRQNADDDGNAAIGRHGAAAQGHAAGGEDGDEHGGQGAADAREQRGAAGELIARVRVGGKGRHHAPVGNIVHGIGDGMQEVHHAEEHDEAPALEGGIERGDHHRRGGQNADGQPGLELAEAGAGTLDDIAHDGIVERVEHPRRHHNGGDGAQLRGGELPGKHHIGEQKIGEQAVGHIPAHRSQGEHPEIAAVAFFLVHEAGPPGNGFS